MQATRMLADFLEAYRHALILRTDRMVIARADPMPNAHAEANGIAQFLDTLIATLRGDSAADGAATRAAVLHGAALYESGYTVAQVVRNYGDLCQAITELAVETSTPIAAEDFHALNLSLDNAMASAITEFARVRDELAAKEETERAGLLAHELRSKVASARLGFEVMTSGRAPLHGAVAGVVARSLAGIAVLVDRMILDVRLTSGASRLVRAPLHEIIEAAHEAAALDATRLGVLLSVGEVDEGVDVHVDRQVLGGVLANLLQNALKFTRRSGLVRLTTTTADGRVTISVEDECGGLPAGALDEMFETFEQRGDDRSGLGLGLVISRRGAEASGGTLRARDLPGHGCVFTVELPVLPPA